MARKIRTGTDLGRQKSTLLYFLGLCLMFFPFSSEAARTTLTPSLGVVAGYDDNIAFERTDEVDDYYFQLSPALTARRETDRSDMSLGANIDILDYLDENDFDTVNQRYWGNLSYQLSELWRVSGRLAFTKDTTLDSALEETGRVFVREDRNRYDAGGAISRRISEKTDVTLRYNYQKFEYDTDLYDEFFRHTVALDYSYKLNNQIDSVSVIPGYSHRDSRASVVDDYSLAFAWRRRWSEITNSSMLLGVRYAEGEGEGGQVLDDWGYIADVSVTRVGLLSRTTLGYRRDLQTQTDGREIEVDRVYGRIERDLSAKFRFSLTASLFLSRGVVEEEGIQDALYFEVNPSLSFRLTRSHFLRLAYSYQNERVDLAGPDDDTSVRSRVWLSLDLNFPKSW